MSSGVDEAVARSLLKKKLLWWRVAAVALFTVAAFSFRAADSHIAGSGKKSFSWAAKKDHLVRLEVSGTIGSDVSLWTKALRNASEDTTVKGLILAVDSPGGAVTGGEELHDEIERFAKKKPVVTSMKGMGASAGYMIALPSRRIFAERSTLTGSIGVILESPDASVLLNKLGVSVNELVSGPLKGQPSPVKPISPEGREMLQGIVSNLFNQFVAMVVAGRHMPEAKVRQLADGRPYTGEQALANGLIDSIGSEDDARDWLAQTCGIKGKPTVVKIGQKTEVITLRRRLLGMAGDMILSWSGLDPAEILPQNPTRLGGAVSIWRP